MKILNLKIINRNEKEIRSIDFNDVGITYIFGNIEKPKDKTKTSNSIGKTLLLKLIDYIFGCNEFNDKNLLNTLNGIKLNAKVKYNNNFYDITRIINEKNIYINNIPYKISEYRKFFNIERSLLEKQIALQSRQSIISILPHATEKDYISVLTLLKLNEIRKIVSEIYSIQEKLSSNKAKCSDYISVLNLDENEIDNSLFLNTKNIENLNEKINSVKEKIKNLKLTNENLNLQSEYGILCNKVKSLRYNLDTLSNEKDNLLKYIEDTETSNLSSEDVQKIYKIAQIEVPELIKRQLNEVDEFYRHIYTEHIEKSKNRIKEIEPLIKNINIEINSLTTRMDELSNILSTNDIYNNALEILNNYNLKLQEENFKRGQLEQLNILKNEQYSLNQQLSIHKQFLKEEYDKSAITINKYKNFVYDIINEIYEKTINALFNISINTSKQNKSPITIDMSISGDLGEGIKEVKKNVMDYLIYKYNTELEIIIHDSCCYNGIDPRQITSLLKHLDEISNANKKQAIVAINKYQIDETFIEQISQKTAIILSEDDKLLKFNF